MLQRCLHKALCGCDSEVYPLVEDLVDCEINSEILKGKNMSMISEMVVRLRKLADQWRHNDVAGCNLIDDVANTIEELSAKVRNNNLHGGWIPVSERLPEDIKPVIITWKNTDPASYYQYIVGKHFIGTGHYCNGKWFWYSSVCEDLLAEYGKSDVDELDEAIEVIAWMPLPEPYKEDEHE